jgi:hypothetical protein
MTPVSSPVPWTPISIVGAHDVEATAAWGALRVARHAAAHATAEAVACSLRVIFICCTSEVAGRPEWLLRRD